MIKIAPVFADPEAAAATLLRPSVDADSSDDFFADPSGTADPLTYASPDQGILHALELSLEEHEICMTIPPGAKLDAQSLDLPGGLIVFGALRGTVNCARGSLIIATGGYFQGHAHAENLICEGEIGSPLDTNGKVVPGAVSSVSTRGRALEGGASGEKIGGVAAFSSKSKVTARIHASAFQISRGANMVRAQIQTLEYVRLVSAVFRMHRVGRGRNGNALFGRC